MTKKSPKLKEEVKEKANIKAIKLALKSLSEVQSKYVLQYHIDGICDTIEELMLDPIVNKDSFK